MEAVNVILLLVNFDAAGSVGGHFILMYDCIIYLRLSAIFIPGVMIYKVAQYAVEC